MADRGIMVQDLFACKNVYVNTPTMLKGKHQLELETVVKRQENCLKEDSRGTCYWAKQDIQNLTKEPFSTLCSTRRPHCVRLFHAL